MGRQDRQAQQQNAAAAPAGSWKCKCGATATGNFCPECGSKKPEPVQAESWTCKCGSVNTGNFCPNCGSKKPAGMLLKMRLEARGFRTSAEILPRVRHKIRQLNDCICMTCGG